MGEKRNVYRLLVGKPEGKRPLGRPRCRWINNIKMDLLEIGLNVVDWISLAQDSSCELGNEPSGFIKCWELPNGCTACGLSCGTRLHGVMYLRMHYRFTVLISFDFVNGFV
jgi:hypothetical protein